ncbi:MAG: hypothetical protein WC745_00175 [Patescibacteria group bacterium]
MKSFFNFRQALIPLAVFLFFFIFQVSAVLAETTAPPTTGLTGKTTAGLLETFKEGYGAEPGTVDLYQRAGYFVGIGLSFLGIIFLGLMIYAGFMWMMARGNAEEVKKAQQMFNDAMIGLIIILGAYAITAYIGSILAAK